MASKKKSSAKKRKGPTAKAKKAYYGLIVKSYKRLRSTLKKHNPAALKGE